MRTTGEERDDHKSNAEKESNGNDNLEEKKTTF